MRQDTDSTKLQEPVIHVLVYFTHKKKDFHVSIATALLRMIVPIAARALPILTEAQQMFLNASVIHCLTTLSSKIFPDQRVIGNFVE